MNVPSSPTIDFYASLQRAFDHFNERLFEGKLPPCLITLRSSSRHFGCHHKDRFVNSEGQKLDELGLHPGFFTLRPVEEVLSTLVHEMVHHWQDCYGNPSKSNPHNRQWSMKMKEVGLEPSATGLPNGKDTGQCVSHYIRPDGLFISACRELVDDNFSLHWFDRYVPRTRVDFTERKHELEEAGVVVELSPSPVDELVELHADECVIVRPPVLRQVDRIKYSCPVCDIRAWSSSGVSLLCGSCSAPMSPVLKSDDKGVRT